MRLSASQLAALVDGMDWSRLYALDIAQPRRRVGCDVLNHLCMS
jgi:hypothetical protein